MGTKLIPLAAVLSLWLNHAAIAQSQPLTKPAWELGLGLGYASLPDYRGSNKSQSVVIPTPYVVFRDEALALEGGEIRARLFGSDRATLDASFDFAFGSALKDNDDRKGMPRLPATLSLGPQISVLAWKSANGLDRYAVRFPFRQAIALSGSTRNAGLVFEPHLYADLRDWSIAPGMELQIEVGPHWGNKRRHELYYSVAPQYATATRSAYAADAGFGGWQSSVSISRRVGQWYAGGYVRYDSLSGAKFANSPLVKRNDGWSVAAGFTWVFSESQKKVPVLR